PTPYEPFRFSCREGGVARAQRLPNRRLRSDGWAEGLGAPTNGQTLRIPSSEMIKSLARLTFALSLVAFVGTLRQWLTLGGDAPIASDAAAGGASGARSDGPPSGSGTRSLGRSLGCEGALDALDAQFDEKRAARRYACTRRRERIEKDESYHPSKKMAFDMFEPEAVCLTDERFGSAKRYEAFGDGPKFVCGVDVVARKSEREGGCLVYSVGSNNHVEFEQSVHTLMGCETHTFDPTLGAPFVGGEYATFHPWGLGEEGETMSYTTYTDGRKLSWVAKGLEGMMRKLGHENRTIDVLKIDCQGCEYAALPPFFDLMAAGKVKVDQLQIELHYRDSWTQLNEFFEAADRAKMRIFHKERNQWGCDGYRCVEYAFASESFLREANRASICAQ
ncbi:hypothetical protein ACHAWF_005645, partial [Thalassiosira exigua]